MSTAEASDLQTRVTRLEDAELARGLQHEYAAALDTPVPAQVASLWTEDGVLSVPSGDVVGHAGITEFYRSRTAADPSEKRHFIMSPRVRHLGPGRVELAAYFVFTARGDARSVLGWGLYLDVVRVVDGVARFEHKTITPHLTTDLASGWPAT